MNDKLTLEEISKRFARFYDWDKAARDIMKDDLLFWGWKPPTRWEKFKINWCSYWSQYKYIPTIIIGGDIHEDCGQ